MTKEAADKLLRPEKKSSQVAGTDTLPETNISHLVKRKIIFKSALVGDMLVRMRVGLCEVITNISPMAIPICFIPCEGISQ